MFYSVIYSIHLNGLTGKVASDMDTSKITHLSLILWKQTVNLDFVSFALVIFINYILGIITD